MTNATAADESPQPNSRSWSEQLLLRTRQRKPVPVGVRAGDAGLLHGAGKAAMLPDLAIGDDRQHLVGQRIAIADAFGVAAARVHHEGLAVFEVAIGRTLRLRLHGRDVAAHGRLRPVRKYQTGDIL